MMLFQSKNISALSEHEAVQTCPLSSDQGNTKMLLQSEPLQGTDVVCSGPGSLSPDFFSHGGISSPGIVRVTQPAHSCEDVWEGRMGKGCTGCL